MSNSTGSQRSRVAFTVAGCLPLVLGVGLALVTGSWMFLAFAAMGAMAALVPLFGGRKRRNAFRGAVDAAVRQDASRRSYAFPDAATLVAASRAGPAPTQPQRSGVQTALRFGTADQLAALEVTPADPGFSAPRLPALPFCIPLSEMPVNVRGPAGAVLSLLHYVVMQLDAADIPVFLLGSAGSIPLAARFLPHIVLATSVSAATHALAQWRRGAGVGSGAHAAVLLLVDEPVGTWISPSPGLRVVHFAVHPSRHQGTLARTCAGTQPQHAPAGPSTGSLTASSSGIDAADSDTAAMSATVELRAAGNHLAGTFANHDFIPDGVPPTVFDAYCRHRALSVAGLEKGPAVQASLEPNTLPLRELCSRDAVVAQWKLSRGGPLRPISLGQSAEGPTKFDFLHDGPHLLLGGTTGSGKSELLRTLAGSLAVAHSPADLQFVFFDFKGGAGLGALCKFPHTSSLITDLGGDAMDRTLASLRAELHLREAALAVCEVADSDSYRAAALHHGAVELTGAHGMAHLVVIIDEFRVLVDQFPDAMAELMRIAAVGRSLGIHLVMATQRPQGALNADIRANVTSSICLRVQSTFDSTDVIGTGVAAAISVSTPGRAFISKAGASPQEFQSAALRLPSVGTGLGPVLEDPGERVSFLPAHSPDPGGITSDVSAVAGLMIEAWQHYRSEDTTLQPATAVIAAELPSEVHVGLSHTERGFGSEEVPCNEGALGGEASLLLGFVDVPLSQSVEPLLWNPELNSHLACLGAAPESSHAVALAAGQVLAANKAASRRAASNGLAARGSAVTGSHAPPRLLYLLDGDGSLHHFAGSPWVGAHVGPDQLRTAAHLVGRLEQTAGATAQTLILCITDWGRWAAAFRASPWHETEDGIAALIRFSHPNLVVLVGGGRELLSTAFLPAIPNRIFLPFGTSPESTMLWPRMPRFKPLRGRGTIAGPVNELVSRDGDDALHIVQLGNIPSVSSQTVGSQHGSSRGGSNTSRHARLPINGSAAAGTLRVSALPDSVSMQQVQEALSGEAPAPGSHGSRGVSVVVGIGGDGAHPVRVTLEPGTVLPVLGSPSSGKSSFLQALEDLNSSSLRGTLQPQIAPRLLWLDDAAALTPMELQQVTESLAAGMVLVAAFNWPGPAVSSLPLSWGLRTAQQGIVLRPRRAADGELFGVRLDTAGAEPYGRGVLLANGERSWFQFPLPGTCP
ncbi:FtsK/SpoIIIE domain-containing protein [Arthrobacter sp.]|uniref:FtsK/SpoIIIE domain-containing protein n=1 Tax=Arthrobacter sp. TaxID=1667 RepID=UPI0026E0182B|nr:FtsK/SpoIIIE domain-containing protein [Arthrobacter sp.]MDO5751443.1 FtsK/SpoIIIE domain-containing protein [Arthrobacter sp.]